MEQNVQLRVAILYPGDRAARQDATPDKNRFSGLFSAFAAAGVSAVPAVYCDGFYEEVFEQLVQLDGVLVWVNPIEGGRDRAVLDAMLREVAAAGVFVSAHPDVILKIGTKDVLYRTRGLGWGCDTHLYSSMDQMQQELPWRLATGKARVLKQYRGNGGDGVWKVQLHVDSRGGEEYRAAIALPQPESAVSVRHAKRGSSEEHITLGEFYERCEQYFTQTGGRMIDQEYQDRLPEGMIRCYLVHDQVAGFGHQAVNALFPAPPGATAMETPQPGPRLYHPPAKPEFQALKRVLEQEWVPAAQELLGIATDALPILWDCDFLLGPRRDNGDDSYVLCEINASSVAPFPESAIPFIVEATVAQMHAARRRCTPGGTL
jgi:hypothetical protein